MASRTSPADGCALMALLVVEVVFALALAVVSSAVGRPAKLLVLLGVSAVVALGAAVVLLRGGHRATAAAQAAVGLLLLTFASAPWPR